MQTIHVTDAKYYIAETAIPEPANNRIRVYDFAYNIKTRCSGGYTCEQARNHARYGTAIVYVPSDTPSGNSRFIHDTSPFNQAIALFAITIVGLYLIGKTK
jgi:hypothetical protein